MFRFARLAALSLTLCSSEGFAQVKLELKFPPGSTQAYESDNKVQQTLTLAGMDIETKANTFVMISKSIGQRGDDGLLPVEEKVTVLQSEIGLPGGTSLQFDSANLDKKADNPLLEPLLERFRVTFKYPATSILDAQNNLKEIKFPAGVAESVNEANKSLFDPVRRKKAADEARGFLPDGPVKKGDTWERSSEADFGSGQIMAFRTNYTYDGTIEQDGQTFDKISAKVFEASFSIDQTNTMVKVSKSDLKVAESEVTILFDREHGAVQQRRSKLRIQGPMTLVINGTELDGKVDLTMEEKTNRQKQ